MAGLASPVADSVVGAKLLSRYTINQEIPDLGPSTLPKDGKFHLYSTLRLIYY